jgi:uncharacterized protein (TIGR03066 family)
MNLSSRLEKLKQKRAAHHEASTPGSLSMPLAPSTMILVALALVLAGLSALAVYESFVWTKVPPELVGLWEIDEGPRKRGTFEFAREGTMEVHLTSNKKHVSHKTRVAVKDRTMTFAAQGFLAPENSPSECTIRELTADTLVLELERGDVLELVRVE